MTVWIDMFYPVSHGVAYGVMQFSLLIAGRLQVTTLTAAL